LSHGVQCVDLLSFLAHGTRSAEPNRETILDERSWDTLLFPDLASNRGSADDVGDGHEHNGSTKAAALTDLLGNLASHYAGAAPGAEEDLAVVATSEQAVLKSAIHLG